MSEKLLHKDALSVYSTEMSSLHIWKVLNHLLFEALAPSVAHSNIGIELGLSCLAITSNAKRKVSGLEPDDFMQICFAELLHVAVNNTETTRINFIKTLFEQGLERNVPYEYAQRCCIAPPIIPNVDTSKHIKHIAHFIRLYDTFRKDVADRFQALTQFSAKRNYYAKAKYGLYSAELEHQHVFVLSLLRAIDKFVPWRGTLASYILVWFENAKGASQYLIFDDEVFGLTRGIRRQVHNGDVEIRNKVIPLSDRENSIPEEKLLEIEGDVINKMAKLPNSTILFYARALPYVPKNTR